MFVIEDKDNKMYYASQNGNKPCSQGYIKYGDLKKDYHLPDKNKLSVVWSDFHSAILTDSY